MLGGEYQSAKARVRDREVHCPLCHSTNLKVTPDEVDCRFDDYDCQRCDGHFQVDRD